MAKSTRVYLTPHHATTRLRPPGLAAVTVCLDCRSNNPAGGASSSLLNGLATSCGGTCLCNLCCSDAPGRLVLRLKVCRPALLGCTGAHAVTLRLRCCCWLAVGGRVRGGCVELRAAGRGGDERALCQVLYRQACCRQYSCLRAALYWNPLQLSNQHVLVAREVCTGFDQLTTLRVTL